MSLEAAKIGDSHAWWRIDHPCAPVRPPLPPPAPEIRRVEALCECPTLPARDEFDRGIRPFWNHLERENLRTPDDGLRLQPRPNSPSQQQVRTEPVTSSRSPVSLASHAVNTASRRDQHPHGTAAKQAYAAAPTRLLGAGRLIDLVI